ncbi:MAG: hypothetical protein DMF63_10180 [Acidobacteria bacterium]|nr:MAG: hypothetical protein DMF63_10180 [Acidobacteriota bacterium]
MVETNSDNTSLDDSLKHAQLMKTYLEIEHLSKGHSQAEAISRYIPLISVVIAVGGFLFGIYQYQKQDELAQKRILFEQQKDRETKESDQALRIQSQMRTDIEQLVQFTKDKQETAAKVRFLLTDLKTYLELEGNLKEHNFKTNKKRDITSSLLKTISNDCDFSQPRDVIFVQTIMTDWEDYKQYLKEHPELNVYIFDKYISALITMYQTDPSVVRGIRYQADRRNFDYTKGYGRLDQAETFYLDDLLAGFDDHMKVHEDAKEKETYLKQFQAATCNPALTQDLFGVKFNPEDLSQFKDIPTCRA